MRKELVDEAGVCYRWGLEKTKTCIEADTAGLSSSSRRRHVLWPPSKVSESAPKVVVVAETPLGIPAKMAGIPTSLFGEKPVNISQLICALSSSIKIHRNDDSSHSLGTSSICQAPLMRSSLNPQKTTTRQLLSAYDRWGHLDPEWLRKALPSLFIAKQVVEQGIPALSAQSLALTTFLRCEH